MIFFLRSSLSIDLKVFKLEIIFLRDKNKDFK